MREYGSEHFLCSKYENVFKQLLDDPNSKNDIKFLRVCRDALAFVYKDILIENSYRINVIVPTLACESMIRPFLSLGASVNYYKIKENLVVDFEDLANKLSTQKINVILIPHYYRYIDFNNQYKKLKEKNKVIIIEDVTQTVFKFDFHGSKADYIVGSIRKWLPILSGAVAVKQNSKFKIMLQPVDNDMFIRTREIALNQKLEYNLDKNMVTKNAFREMLKNAEESLGYGECFLCDEESLCKIKSMNTHEISYIRERNYLFLSSQLGDLQSIKLFDFLSDFMLPIVIKGKNRDEVQRCFAKNGIYSQVLWPITEVAEQVDLIAAKFSHNMLALPIDQRYGHDDMVEISKIVQTVLY